MELSVRNLIIENDVTSNSSNDLANYERTEVAIRSDNLHNKHVQIATYLYQVFVHVFIFSIFESLFFWFYITTEEDEAIMNQIGDVVLVGNLFCTNINDDIDFSSLYDYQKEKRNSYNEKLPFNNTILLNSYLFSTIVLLNIILKFSNVSLIRLNYKIMKEQSIIFLLLFTYEYLFFRNIIYNYVPDSSNKIIKKIFEKCI